MYSKTSKKIYYVFYLYCTDIIYKIYFDIKLNKKILRILIQNNFVLIHLNNNS
jgi:hypothetical protein